MTAVRWAGQMTDGFPIKITDIAGAEVVITLPCWRNVVSCSCWCVGSLPETPGSVWGTWVSKSPTVAAFYDVCQRLWSLHYGGKLRGLPHQDIIYQFDGVSFLPGFLPSPLLQRWSLSKSCLCPKYFWTKHLIFWVHSHGEVCQNALHYSHTRNAPKIEMLDTSPLLVTKWRDGISMLTNATIR